MVTPQDLGTAESRLPQSKRHRPPANHPKIEMRPTHEAQHPYTRHSPRAVVSTRVDMTATANLFKHGGSQAVRLPKAFRFEGSEVEIEKRGKEVVLRPKKKKKFKTWKALMDHLNREFPGLGDFPNVPRPKEQQQRDLTW